MKKIATIVTAALMCSGAYAQDETADDMSGDESMEMETMPTTAETTTYDGPDSSTPGQPAPSDWSAVLRSQSMATFQATNRADYPTCSTEVRDNCVQARDPGY